MKAPSKELLHEIGRRYDAATDRAAQLGFADRVLQLAKEDRGWREALEEALTHNKILRSMLKGGGKPGDVWNRSLVRRNVIAAIESNPKAFVEIAHTCPAVLTSEFDETPTAEDLLALNPVVAVLVVWVRCPEDLDTTASALERACDWLEETAVTAEASARKPVKPEKPQKVTPTVDASLLAGAQKEIKALKKSLREREAEVARKDRKILDLGTRAKSGEADCTQVAQEARQFKAERDELKRQLRDARADTESMRTGKRTIEQRRSDETQRNQETISDLRDRLAASQEFASAKERQVDAVSAELLKERATRLDLEDTLAAFGIEDVGSSLSSLQVVLDGLSRVREGMKAYADRQQEGEREAARLRDTAEQERQAAEEAQRLRAEQEAAWSARETARLEDMETDLFPDGQIDQILIDGHNLVHRVFRPEDEARTRPWLEHMVGVMAARLESRGWSTCTHLVFDTQYNSNDRAEPHGVRVHFKNKANEGGADARIAELLREGSPTSRYMIVSTDRKHVWSDAEDHMREEGVSVDLVQIEMLARYLQALEEMGN